MAQSIHLSLDAMGGDNAPEIVVEGAAQSKIRYPNLIFSFFGDEEKVSPLISSFEILKNSNIIHTNEIVDANEKPSVALRKGKNSSMSMAIQLVKSGKADALVSAGNTGALMAMTKLFLRPMDKITRPAIAAYFPTIVGESCMLDLGANIECDAQNLVQFAIMGQAFANIVMGIKDPSISLLNIGEEEQKGLDYIKEASQILYSLKNIEKKFGRKVGQRWGNRVLDLDILGKGSTILPNLKVFNNWMRMPFELQISKQPMELILPHPRIQDRLFVLQPLKEVNPNWVHPVLNQTAKDLILSKDWGKEDLLKKIENKNFLLKC